MAIMFKKSVALIFLLSQILTVSASGNRGKPKTFKKYANAKATRISPKSSSTVEPDPPKTITMKLRPKKSSPLGISELSSGSIGSSTLSIGTPVEEAKIPERGVKLVHFVEEDIDGFEFDLLGFNEEEKVQKAKPVMDALIEAISAGDLNSVRTLISKEEVNLNSFEKGPRTPFMLAIQARNAEIVEAMLASGKVDPNFISADGCDVLTLAAYNFPTLEVVDKILRGPVKLTPLSAFTILSNLKNNARPILRSMIAVMARTRDLNLLCALVVMTKDAVIADEVDLVRFMHSVGVPLNKNYRGLYFIHYAADRGNAEMVDLLIVCGTPVDILTRDTQISALQCSVSRKEHATTVLLIKKGATHGLNGCIFDAILNNKIAIIEALVSTYPNLNGVINFENGFDPITLAIAADKPEILRLILESGSINPFLTDFHGNNIYNMEISEHASHELKAIVQSERDFVDDIISTIETI